MPALGPDGKSERVRRVLRSKRKPKPPRAQGPTSRTRGPSRASTAPKPPKPVKARPAPKTQPGPIRNSDRRKVNRALTKGPHNDVKSDAEMHKGDKVKASRRYKVDLYNAARAHIASIDKNSSAFGDPNKPATKKFVKADASFHRLQSSVAPSVPLKALLGGKHLALKAAELSARPSHAIAASAKADVKDIQQHGFHLFGTAEGHKAARNAAKRGIEGKDHTGFSDVLKQAGVLKHHDTARGVLGFLGDVGVDPFTYVTGGTSSVAKHVAEKEAEKVVRAGAKAARKAKTADEAKIIRDRATKEARRRGEEAAKGKTHDRGFRIGIRVPITGERLETSGRASAKVNRVLGKASRKGGTVTSNIREGRIAQHVTGLVAGDVRRAGVDQGEHEARRRVTREGRAQRHRGQQKATHRVMSGKKAVKDEAARKQVTAAREGAPHEPVPTIEKVKVPTPRHAAQRRFNKANVNARITRRQEARAVGAAKREDVHVTRKLLDTPEARTAKVAEKTERTARSAERSASSAEKALRRTVLKQDEDVKAAVADLSSAVSKRAKLRTRYGNEARAKGALRDDEKLTGHVEALQEADAEVNAARAAVRKAIDKAHDKPLGKDGKAIAERMVNDVHGATARARTARTKADEAIDTAKHVRSSREERAAELERRGYKNPVLADAERAGGKALEAEQALRKAGRDVARTPHTKKKFELGLRVQHTGENYLEFRKARPKAQTPHVDVERHLRADQERMALEEERRGLLKPGARQSFEVKELAAHEGRVRKEIAGKERAMKRLKKTDSPAYQRLRQETDHLYHELDDIRHQWTDVNRDPHYMQHEMPEVVSPAKTKRGRSVQDRTRKGRGAGFSPKLQRKWKQLSAREVNEIRKQEDLPPLFEEDFALLHGHRTLVHEQAVTKHNEATTLMGVRDVPTRDQLQVLAEDPKSDYGVFERTSTNAIEPVGRDVVDKAISTNQIPKEWRILHKENTLLAQPDKWERQWSNPGFYSRLIGGFKSAATVWNPSYYVGNELGNRIMAWQADTTVSAWSKSLKAVRLLGKRNAFERSAEAAKGKLFRDTRSESDKKLFDLVEEAERYGGLSGFHSGELRDLRGTLGKNRAVSARRFAERRENQARLATYISARERGMVPEKAAEWTNRHHIDYGDLTGFEQKVRDIGIPFYTFTARNTRLQIEKAFSRPGKLATFEKVREDLAKAEGEDPEFANVLQRYQQAGLPFVLRFQGYSFLLFPRSPIDQGLGMLPASGDDAAMQVINRFNPIVKLPAELALNFSSFFRRDIEDAAIGTDDVPAPAWAQYLPGPLKSILKVHQNQKNDWMWRGKADQLIGVTPQTKFVTDITRPENALHTQSKSESQLAFMGIKIVSQAEAVKRAKVVQLTQHINALTARREHIRRGNVKGVSAVDPIHKKFPKADPVKSAQLDQLDTQIANLKKRRTALSKNTPLEPLRPRPQTIEQQVQQKVKDRIYNAQHASEIVQTRIQNANQARAILNQRKP